MIDPIGQKPSDAAAPATAQGERAVDEQRDTGKVAEDFTAVLMQMVVRQMFETVKAGGGEENGGPFGGSDAGGDVYRGLAETAFGQALARNGVDSLTSVVQRAIDRVARDVPDEPAGAERKR